MDISYECMDYSKIFDIRHIQPQINVTNYLDLEDEHSWGPRILPDYELILIRRGLFLYEEQGAEVLKLSKGCLLTIPPGLEHSFSLESKEGAFSCIHCVPLADVHWESGLFNLSPVPSRVTDFSHKFSYIDELFKKCDLLFRNYSSYSGALAGSVCHEIFLHCAEQWDGKDPLLSVRMKSMIEYIRDNLSIPLSRNELATEFNLTAEYINALFKKELNLTPSACINKEKVFFGYKMLHNKGISVAETAYACGFTDPFYFSRVFKKVLGISPNTVRSRKSHFARESFE